ncbi:MAG: type II toxin-antitoxin system VapC family toxin [Candidatus Dormibacteria bacterium]
MAIWYLDPSALAKLVPPETETQALRRWLSRKPWVVSDLQRTELRRAGGRALAHAEWLLAESDVLRIDADVFDRAARMQPASLRSLDALHLAAAMNLGPDLSGIVGYDQRFLHAVLVAGVPTASPGARPSH